MNIEQLISLMRAYFTYTGMLHKFAGQGRFAYIDLRQRLRSFTDRYDSDKNFRLLIENILSWDGQFQSLAKHDRALRELAELVLYDVDLSQAAVIHHWTQYCQANGKDCPDNMKEGICYGLAMASVFGQVAGTDAAQVNDMRHLHDLEQLLADVALRQHGSSKKTHSELFSILSKLVLPLQENQDADFHPIASLIPESTFPELALGIGLVHTHASLRALFDMILIPGNAMILGTADHAACVYVTNDRQIVYYDPNSKYGNKIFDSSAIEHFIYNLQRDFSNNPAGRFSLVTKVYARHQKYNIDDVFKKLKMVCREHGMPLQTLLENIGPDGKNALLLAAENNLSEFAGYLLRRGCNPDIRGIKNLNNAFHSAASMRNPKTLKVLLNARRPAINAYNRAGLTPLHVAVYDNCSDAVAAMLDCKHVNIGKLTAPESGVAGKTAIEMAAILGHEEILEMLSAKYAYFYVMQAASN